MLQEILINRIRSKAEVFKFKSSA